MSRPKVIQNAARIKSTGQIIKSTHRHDQVMVKLPSGKDFFIDGGLDYIRYVPLCNDEVEYLFLDETSSDEEVLDKLLWGTRGVDGDQPLEYKFIKDLDSSHLQAILDNVPSVGEIHKKVIMYHLSIKRYNEDKYKTTNDIITNLNQKGK